MIFIIYKKFLINILPLLPRKKNELKLFKKKR